jgi:hypothetical protein
MSFEDVMRAVMTPPPGLLGAPKSSATIATTTPAERLAARRAEHGGQLLASMDRMLAQKGYTHDADGREVAAASSHDVTATDDDPGARLNASLDRMLAATGQTPVGGFSK